MKMFADQQMIGAEAPSYLVNRMEDPGSPSTKDRLNNASLATKRRITVPLARDVILITYRAEIRAGGLIFCLI